MMRLASLLAVSWLLLPTLCAPVADQRIISDDRPPAPQRLHGRFLHISDLHPDAFYKLHSSTAEADACHRGKGTAGHYGAETSDCDTPHSLINATFKWIAENIKDTVDFVVWTGDSARHDSDEEIPRTTDQVLKSNKWIAEKFADVFSSEDNPKELAIPIVATFGNNDILPHNILLSGPNKWLRAYTNVWRKFIPEEQRHGFERGGWYYVEVIPGKLAVFSLNTLYFFDNNAAVDGCALRSEPGYEHLEWLRIQLQFMRERGMKAILMGHVPPARTDSKQLWDETCWQKYTLWLRQYRDVVVGGLYGHMNIDHFMLQDTQDVNILSEDNSAVTGEYIRATMDEELSIQSANDYLEDLRDGWSDLPNPKLVDGKHQMDNTPDGSSKKKKKSKKDKKREKAEKKLGGKWGERFLLTHVSPSVVPNYFPTLRVIEYNITGLDRLAVWANPTSWFQADQTVDLLAETYEVGTFNDDDDDDDDHGADIDEESGFVFAEEDKTVFKTDLDTMLEDEDFTTQKKKKNKKDKKKKKKKKRPTNPDLHVPNPPSKSSPPGPAYSPQTLTMLGYTQYFANLTYINNDFVKSVDEDMDAEKWREGIHKGKRPTEMVEPKRFKYQVEYDTFTDGIYKLKDMTVMSYIKLAHRIGQYKHIKGDQIEEPLALESPEADSDCDVEYIEDNVRSKGNEGEDNHQATGGKKKNHKKKKHHKQRKKNKVWLNFIQRAFVGTLEEEKLRKLEIISEPEMPAFREDDIPLYLHDGEL